MIPVRHLSAEAMALSDAHRANPIPIALAVALCLLALWLWG